MLGACYGEEEIEAFEKALAEYFDTRHAISVSAASCGLDMAMMCLGLEPGDEVICPSVNFRAAPMDDLLELAEGKRAKSLGSRDTAGVDGGGAEEEGCVVDVAEAGGAEELGDPVGGGEGDDRAQQVAVSRAL